MTLVSCYEVDFKFNLILNLKNWLIKLSLYPIIY